MPDTRWFALEADNESATLRLTGAWRLPHLAEIEAALTGLALPPALVVDGSGLGEIDSAAALVLLRALRTMRASQGGLSWEGFSAINGRIDPERDGVALLLIGGPEKGGWKEKQQESEESWSEGRVRHGLGGGCE